MQKTRKFLAKFFFRDKIGKKPTRRLHPIKIFNRLKKRDVREEKKQHEMTKIENKFKLLFDLIILSSNKYSTNALLSSSVAYEETKT